MPFFFYALLQLFSPPWFYTKTTILQSENKFFNLSWSFIVFNRSFPSDYGNDLIVTVIKDNTGVTETTWVRGRGDRKGVVFDGSLSPAVSKKVREKEISVVESRNDARLRVKGCWWEYWCVVRWRSEGMWRFEGWRTTRFNDDGGVELLSERSTGVRKVADRWFCGWVRRRRFMVRVVSAKENEGFAVVAWGRWSCLGSGGFLWVVGCRSWVEWWEIMTGY